MTDATPKLIQDFLEDANSVILKLLSRHPTISKETKLQVLQLEALRMIPVCEDVLKSELANAIVEATTRNPKKDMTSNNKKKPIRVYVDGCFDIMHSGHYNVLRQAKALGDILVAGVHTNAEIMKNKGRPVMKDEERLRLVKACKYVDEVVWDTPYAPTIELLDREDVNADFVVHGDDLPVAVGSTKHAYWDLQQAGRLRIVKRTEGVSTTDLVGRLLLATSGFGGEKRGRSRSTSEVSEDNDSKSVGVLASEGNTLKVGEDLSRYLPTSSRVAQFSNRRVPSKSDTVVYIAGDFDMFHIGHIEILEKARKLGGDNAYLLVGIWDDKTVNFHSDGSVGTSARFDKTMALPIMKLHERVINVLSCKHADDVIIGAPWVITNDLITTFNIKIVVNVVLDNADGHCLFDTSTCFGVASDRGVLKTLRLKDIFTINRMVNRIIENRQAYVDRNKVRAKKELDYISKDKDFLEEVSKDE